MTCIRALGTLAIVGMCVGTARAQGDAPMPAAAQPATAASTSRWIRFKGDLQRTSTSAATVTLPLNLAWRYSSDEPPRGNASTPIVAGPAGLRRIYFSTGNAVMCLEANTGTMLWKTDLTGYARAPISLLEGGEGGDLIVATTSSGTINAMRASDGTVLWTAETRAPVGGIEPIPVQTAKGLRLVQAIQTGKLIAFGADGARDADFDIKLGRNGATPTATPTVSKDGKMLFVPGQDRNMYAISLEDNSVAWVGRLGSTAYLSPVPAGDAIVSQVNDEVVALYAADGQLKWRADLKLPLTVPLAVTEANGKSIIYAGTTSGKYYALDGEDGTTIWETDVEAGLTGAPLVLPNAILLGTRNGMLVALSPADGKIIWRYRLHTERETAVVNQDGGGGRGGRGQQMETKTYPVASAPAVVDGQIYVVADNAALYSLSSTPLDTEPPLAIKPSISVRASDGKPRLMEVSSRRPVLVPGKAPILFTAEIDDPGSGIDPAGFRVTLNDTEIEKDKLVFQPATGMLTAILAAVDPTQTVVLPDGVYTVGVLARDTRGNALTFTTSFTVDKSVPAPNPEGQGGPGGGGGGRGGRGGRGGGGGAFGGQM